MQVIRSITEGNSRYKGEKVKEYRREKDVLEIKMNTCVSKCRSAQSHLAWKIYQETTGQDLGRERERYFSFSLLID